MIRIIYKEYDEKTLSDAREKARFEHRLGRTLLGRLLAEQGLTPVNLSALEDLLDQGIHGKPCLKDRKDLHFNISHCPGLAACAISTEPVGLDVERIRPFPESVLKKLLTEEERQWLAMGDFPREEALFRLWTLKESRIKLSGEGLRQDLRSFSCFPDRKKARICSSEPDIFYKQWQPLPGYIMSVCSASPPEDDLLPERVL